MALLQVDMHQVSPPFTSNQPFALLSSATFSGSAEFPSLIVAGGG